MITVIAVYLSNSITKNLHMRHLLCAFFLLLAGIGQAQQTAIKKPSRIIVVNDSISSMDKVNQYGKDGYIKAIHNGISEEEMKRLQAKLGDKVGDERQFVIVVTLLTEEEKKIKDSQPKPAKQATQPVDDGYILNVNDKAADFTVAMLTGKPVKLSDLKGKVVLINFWATWCGPCMMEFYEIPSKIIAPFKDKEFVFLAISRGETQELVAKKMAELKTKGIDFNVGMDPDKSIWNKYGTVGIPKNYLIDQNGVIRYVSTGYGDTKVDQMAEEIKKLLNSQVTQ
jgi:peroxiredoxin